MASCSSCHTWHSPALMTPSCMVSSPPKAVLCTSSWTESVRVSWWEGAGKSSRQHYYFLVKGGIVPQEGTWAEEVSRRGRYNWALIKGLQPGNLPRLGPYNIFFFYLQQKHVSLLSPRAPPDSFSLVCGLHCVPGGRLHFSSAGG